MSPRVSQVKLQEQTLKLQAKRQKTKTSRHSVKTCQNKGELVEHQKYDDYKSSISNLALARGYLDGKFQISRLEISPETHEAWWRMLFDSGVRYHYGNITFNHSQIREDYLQNMLNINRATPYLVVIYLIQPIIFLPPTGLAPYFYNRMSAKKRN